MSSARGRRWLNHPVPLALLAVAALAAGILLSRNAARSAAERAEQPPRVDCVRFPGACAPDVPTAAPVELAELSARVADADAMWQTLLERERRAGIFPAKGLTAMQDALATTDAAVRDAHALLADAERSNDPEVRAAALEALREAWDAKHALLARAVRLLEETL